MGCLRANFSLPRPLGSRLRPDVRDRQTSDAHHRLVSPLWGGHDKPIRPLMDLGTEARRSQTRPLPFPSISPPCSTFPFPSFTRPLPAYNPSSLPLASHWPCVTDTVHHQNTGSTAKDREMSTYAYAPSGRGTIYLTSLPFPLSLVPSPPFPFPRLSPSPVRGPGERLKLPSGSRAESQPPTHF